MKRRVVLCLLVLLGLAACRRGDKMPGSSAQAVTCDPEEPTQLCFQVGNQKPVLLLTGDGRLTVTMGRGNIFVRFWVGQKSYRVDFGPEAAGQLVPGTYRDAVPFWLPSRSEAARLDVEIDGSCQGPGSFILYDIAFDETGTAVRRLDVAFESVRCGPGSDLPVQGRLRLNEAGQGLKDRLARFFGPPVSEHPPAPALSLQTVDDLCPVDADRFLCLQGNAGAWAAAGRRQLFTHGRGWALLSQSNSGGNIRFFVSQERNSSMETVDVDLYPRRGTLLAPGLYQSSDTKQDNETEPYLKVGQCHFDRRGPSRFYVYEAELGLDGVPRHFLADFESRCGPYVVVGRVALSSKLVAKARVEAAGDPERLRVALARILGESRKRIAATPQPGGAPVAGRLRVTGADENVPSQSPEPAPPIAAIAAVPEADARCSADGRTFERRGDVWMESGTEHSQPTRTLSRGQEPKFDLVILKARVWTALNLGPKVRATVDGQVTEILQGDGYPKESFAGVRCEVFGKVRLPRRTAEMGSALDAQLRKDGKRGLRVSARFVVDRNGKVSELLAADGLPEEYRALFLEDLQKMTYEPATLDGRPVPVVQSGTLTY